MSFRAHEILKMHPLNWKAVGFESAALRYDVL